MKEEIGKFEEKTSVDISNRKREVGEEQKPDQAAGRTYFTVHCPYCGEQRLYAKDKVVYCANEKCPNGKKPVDIDRYNLRRFIF